MLTPELLSKEIYLFEHERKTIAYAPLTRSFDIRPGIIAKDQLNKEWIKSASNIDNVPEFIHNKSFGEVKNKIRLRMNITSKCNLNCEYCSISANKKPGINMDRKLSFSVIDHFVQFAEEHEIKELEVTFSGGEPTLLGGLIKDIVTHMDNRLKSSKIVLTTKLLTNGLLSEELITKLTPLFNGIQISWDGFMDEHPRKVNLKKQDEVNRQIWKNIGIFLREGSLVNIATVVSENNYKIIEEIVDQIYETYGIDLIFLALKDTLGKASSDSGGINYVKLRNVYSNLWKKYRKKNIDIGLTGTDIHSISQVPCGVSVPNYSISPAGDISACTVSFNDVNPYSKFYKFGKITKSSLVLDKAKMTALRAINTISIKECEDCPAKWHCRGGCMYANRGQWQGNKNPERCDMTRKIIGDKILYLANFKSGD